MQAGDAHSKPIDAVFAQFGCDPNAGLTQTQVQEALRQYGPNELTEKPRPGFLALLWEQFNNYLVIILIVAAALAFALGEVVDAMAILCIVVLNAVIGVVQEAKAEQALAGMLAEWDKFTRYGSPLAKAANEPIAHARRVHAKLTEG